MAAVVAGGYGGSAADDGLTECSVAVEEQYAAQKHYLSTIPSGADPDPAAAAELLATTARTYAAAGSCAPEQAAWLAAERSYALAEADPEQHLAEYDELVRRVAGIPRSSELTSYGDLVRYRQARSLRLAGRIEEALALYEDRTGPVSIHADVGRAVTLELYGDVADSYTLWMDIHDRTGRNLQDTLSRRMAMQARQNLDRLVSEHLDEIVAPDGKGNEDT